MIAREPALPVDPRLPGEPTALEVGCTRLWLGRRGVRVWLPTRLLALRIGARGFELRRRPEQAVVAGVLAAFFPVLTAGTDLPGRGAALAVLFASVQVLRWRRMQRRERLAERLTAAGTPPSLRVAARQVGWWYLSAVAVTFVGGAVLCAAMFLTAPRFGDHWYPLSVDIALSTIALAVGAGATALVLGKTLRSPVIAEDEASRLIDEALRAEDAHRYASCAAYALFAVPVLMMAWEPPALLEWAAWAYLAVAAALELTGWLLLRRRYRRLPPGFYGR
ncbi:hypothetical protein QRX60_18520 [Amycolatopsis mongoliensis]|uniref:Uncharacterized protein n=1 Tax=Amycolatopsis mongoliensis TaxID=715475 RepID=A0A9Y2JX01_9PSEU|nr:hypothetical protein [Amycolatopsis sp. 4-36]WIY05738.1 hypothetical protein QRX60_18520 [Amycolatopsis sp. 4-36]